MDTDRNLLFGVLALQADMIDAVQFADVCAGWAARKQVPLGDLLVERGHITAEDRQVVERLLERKLKKHSGNVRASLGVVADSTARDALRQAGDPEIRAVLDALPSSGDTSPPPGAPAPPPARSPRYAWLGVHGEGNLGRVWRARDNDLNREVALKVIRPALAHHPEARRRLLQEAQITGQLEHPGIVPVYELGHRPEDDQPFYVMRLVRGQTLGSAIANHHAARKDGQLDPLERRRLLGLFLSVCNAVAYAHSRGVLHRDLKPENVVLGAFGEVNLLDWGLAKVLGSPAAETEGDPVMLTEEARGQATVLGRTVGSPAYMAPEQAARRQDLVEPRTDVYGLGAILFEILTGRPPHQGKNTEEVLERIATGETPSARSAEPSVPRALDRICARAMAREPADRYPSAADLARAVQVWLDDEPVAVYREAVGKFEALLRAYPNQRHYREGLARQLVALGLVLQGMDRKTEAEETYRAAITHYEQLAADPGADPRYRTSLADCRLYLADVLYALDRKAQAEDVRRQAAEDYEQLIRTSPADRQHLLDIAAVRTIAVEPEEVPPRPEQVPAAAEEAAPRVEPPQAGPPTPPTLHPPPDGPAAGPARTWDAGLSGEGPGPGLLEGPAYATLPPPAFEDPHLVGTPLGNSPRYCFLRLHARGGLGEVYLAQDEALHRQVALKQIQDRYADDPHSRARFLHEAEITAGLEHPGVVPIYSLGQDSRGRPFYAMRLIRGSTLQDAITRFHQANGAGSSVEERAVGLRRLLDHLLDVCNTVAYAHSRGVIHRDLKPANIMVGHYGETLVLDWGVAKVMDRPEAADAVVVENLPLRPTSPRETMVGGVVGTPAYMSPEQSLGRTNWVGPESDVYSLGALLYQILTGRAPFEGPDVRAILLRVQQGAFPRPRQVDSRIAPALEAICLKAMAFKPGDRYPSPRALADDLEHWLADEPVSAYREPWGPPLARWLRGHRVWLWLVVAALPAAAALLTMALLRR